MADSTETDLLRQAARAGTLEETSRLMAEAQAQRDARTAGLQRERELDLADTHIRQTLTPAMVHEHHTAATDWLGEVSTGGEDCEREMVARGSLWYSKTSAIRPFQDEWQEQARGEARKLAGAYGEQADAAEEAFLTHVGQLYHRELGAGMFELDDSLTTTAASGVPQVGDPGNPEVGGTVGPPSYDGVPGELTSSDRASVMQSMENNTGGGNPSSGDPSVLSAGDVDADNGDSGTNGDHADWHRLTGARHKSSHSTPSNLKPVKSSRKESPMDTATCPSCSGRGRVAVRHEGASGLDQIEQTRDPKDNPVTEPGVDWSVAFPWEMNPNAQGNAIAETEKQLAEREQRKGASRQQRAEAAAQAMYRRVLAGQDDSGWLGDMGAGGVTPGEQDGGNPGPPDNIGVGDPVYGDGGDNPNQPMKPYGADEADDVTNKPAQYSPGQPLQNDLGGRGQQVGQATGARIEQDPEIQRALAFVRQRRAYLSRQD